MVARASSIRADDVGSSEYCSTTGIRWQLMPMVDSTVNGRSRVGGRSDTPASGILPALTSQYREPGPSRPSRWPSSACWNPAQAPSLARQRQNPVAWSARGPSPSIASSSAQANGVWPMHSRLYPGMPRDTSDQPGMTASSRPPSTTATPSPSSNHSARSTRRSSCG